MNLTKLIAIDPGLTGALACYDVGAGRLDVIDMPTQEIVKKSARKNPKTGKKPSRDVIDEVELMALLTTFNDLGYTNLFIEQVGGIPGQSAPAAFTFGYGVGLIVGVARALGMRVERVPAATWKAKLRVPADKREARKRASEILPTHAHLWPFQKDADRAEAAMLAVYGEMVTREGR